MAIGDEEDGIVAFGSGARDLKESAQLRWRAEADAGRGPGFGSRGIIGCFSHKGILGGTRTCGLVTRKTLVQRADDPV
jgi:hypothetical protein